ncbi:hypothetical protein [Streptomyces daliensis]|uniref:Uncharacterized protein n=1 Tax=Streptomyces daliensis TaxID=299421 RepID=A0A8T4IUN1_9ACTN|nr:hypothetical protein [Streptomyces daliensis]
MAEFRLPFALRAALQERLLKAQVLATATAVVIGCPALILFNLTVLDAHVADGEIPGLAVLITTVAAVLLFSLTAVGGVARSPKNVSQLSPIVSRGAVNERRTNRRVADSDARVSGWVWQLSSGLGVCFIGSRS